MRSIDFNTIVGQDPGFRNAVDSARLAAQSPFPVVLFGETGTGKEMFARAIHNAGPRDGGKYTPLNCSSIAGELLERIVSGSSKGEFNGSVGRDTLFLDEINSMSIGSQGRLLEIIRERRVKHLCSEKAIKPDLKIISSINRDPFMAISQGRLLAELFYSLGVFFIYIAPLRKRIGDLELLVDHFIGKHNGILEKEVKGLEEGVMDLFLQYHWPGNVRELEHVIEGAMNIMDKEKRIGFSNLRLNLIRCRRISPI